MPIQTKRARNAKNSSSAHNSVRSKPSRFDHLLWTSINKNTKKTNNLVNVNQEGTTVKLGTVPGGNSAIVETTVGTTFIVRGGATIKAATTFEDDLTVNKELFVNHGTRLKTPADSTTAVPTDFIVGLDDGGQRNPYQEDGTAKYPLGTKLQVGNRTFRYMGTGNAAITAGKLLQHPAKVANHQGMTSVGAHGAGVSTIEVTLGGTAVTADQYAGGYLWINDGDGEGQLLRIKSHPAQATAGGNVTITCYDGLVTALNVANSKVSIVVDPYSNAVVAPVTEAGALMGATVIDMAANKFGWAQTSGPASLLTVGTLVPGNAAVRSGATTAGGVAPATDNVLQEVGDVMAAAGDGEYSLINMKLE